MSDHRGTAAPGRVGPGAAATTSPPDGVAGRTPPGVTASRVTVEGLTPAIGPLPAMPVVRTGADRRPSTGPGCVPPEARTGASSAQPPTTRPPEPLPGRVDRYWLCGWLRMWRDSR